MLEMEVWKMTPNFLIGHMVGREAITRQRMQWRMTEEGER
jgi:hypothetical protein